MKEIKYSIKSIQPVRVSDMTGTAPVLYHIVIAKENGEKFTWKETDLWLDQKGWPGGTPTGERLAGFPVVRYDGLVHLASNDGIALTRFGFTEYMTLDGEVLAPDQREEDAVPSQIELICSRWSKRYRLSIHVAPAE